MTTIIDLTRAWDGTETGVLDAVMKTMAPGSTASVHLIIHARQRDALPTIASEASTEVFDDSAAVSDVAASIGERLRILLEEAASDINVYSFSPGVRQVVSAWEVMRPGAVQFIPLAAFSTTERPAAPLPGAWDAGFMSEDDALDLVCLVISRAPHQQIHKTQLRHLLAALDPRFSKRTPGFPSSPGFITTLVNLAEGKQLIRQEGVEPKIELLLTATGAGRAQTVTPSAPAAEHEHPRSVETEREQSTSTQYVDAWRSASLGPFMTVRTQIYDEIDKRVASGPQPLDALVRDAVRAVRESNPEIRARMPWSRARLFVEELMRKRPVAISDGQTVALTWGNGDLLVDDLAPEWKEQLDGVLVLFLIDRGFDIRYTDIPDLAGALYGSREDEMMDRANAVVERLMRDELIDTSDATKPIQRISPPRHSPEPAVAETIRTGNSTIYAQGALRSATSL